MLGPSAMFEWIRCMIFEKASRNIKPGSLKNITDPVFVFIEKFAYEFPFFTEKYLAIYEEMINGELSLLSAIDTKKILIVGSGSLPATSILFARLSDAQVVGIDIDGESVVKANHLVKRMGFDESKLHFFQENGIDADLRGFDVVILLYGIRQQKKMLEYASKELDDGAHIIVRATCENDQIKIDSECLNLSELFDVVGHAHSSVLGPIESYLLKKKSVF